MTATALFFGGRPTAPQVQVLMSAFEYKEGDVIPYGAIAATIDERVGSSRFRSVTEAWRRALRKERNIELGNVRFVGMKVLPPVERMHTSVRGVAKGVRQISKSGRHLRSIPTVTLTDGERNTHLHTSRHVDVMEMEMRANMMKIKVQLAPTPTNPRIGPPEVASK